MSPRSKLFRWMGWFFAIAWILVLSEFVFSNLKVTTELKEQLNSQNQTATVQVLESKVIELMEQVAELQNTSNKTAPSDMETLQTHWNAQFKALQEQGSQYALSSELMLVWDEVKTLQERVTHIMQTEPKVESKAEPKSDLNPQAGQLWPATTQDSKSAAVSNTKPAPVKPAALHPPFKVIGVELRQGHRVLTLLSHKSKSASDIQLLRIGQQYSGWVLKELDDQAAVFKVGNRTRTIQF